MKLAFWLLLAGALLCTIVGVAPLVSAGTAQWIADSHGCTLNEGTSHPCVVMGRDVGDLLYTMGVAGWLSLVTIWVLVLAVPFWVAWFVVVVVWIVQRASVPAVGPAAGPVR